MGIALTTSSLATLSPVFRKIKIFTSSNSIGHMYGTGMVDYQFQSWKTTGPPSRDKASAERGGVAKAPVLASTLKAETEYDVEAPEGAS